MLEESESDMAADQRLSLQIVCLSFNHCFISYPIFVTTAAQSQKTAQSRNTA